VEKGFQVRPVLRGRFWGWMRLNLDEMVGEVCGCEIGEGECGDKSLLGVGVWRLICAGPKTEFCCIA